MFFKNAHISKTDTDNSTLFQKKVARPCTLKHVKVTPPPPPEQPPDDKTSSIDIPMNFFRTAKTSDKDKRIY